MNSKNLGKKDFELNVLQNRPCSIIIDLLSFVVLFIRLMAANNIPFGKDLLFWQRLSTFSYSMLKTRFFTGYSFLL